MTTRRTTLVYGPAYLDRVLRVDRPLAHPSIGGVIDRSANAGPILRVPNALRIVGLPGGDVQIAPPDGWPGPFGWIPIDGGTPTSVGGRGIRGVAWHDDLGGMGAGFARAFGGTLRMPIGPASDPVIARLVELLAGEEIAFEPLEVPGRSGEWTLLITSGEFGDKLAIGFRDPSPCPLIAADGPCDLLVAASMTNARASAALASPGARVRLFAPAIRNMIDREPGVSAFARHIDILCCNRVEWEALDDREEVAWRVSILAVTDGPNGAEIRYTTPTGEAGRLTIPAFPRREPPLDTNRAGEAFASTLVTTLLDAGWTPGVTTDDMVRLAALRASAASALVLDRIDFGFPSGDQIDRAVSAGIV